MTTIVFDVSGHGLGHLAQVGCVVGHLRERRPDCRVIVRSAHAPRRVESFCGGQVETRIAPDEPTLVMQGPILMDRAASAAAYDAFHAGWEREIAARAATLADLRPDLLVSDIPYASLAAAEQLSVPSIALCSLNWRDMRAAYCGAGDDIAATIEAAYQSARAFLQPAPHMPMTWLRNARAIGPIGRSGADRSRELRRMLGVAPARKLVLVSFGGIAGGPALDFSRAPDMFFVAPHRSSDNSASIDETRLPLIDVLASVDAVVTKDGYATLVEAAVNGVPILMLARADWPETPHFIEWGQKHACFRAIPAASGASDVIDALHALVELPRVPAVAPAGIVEATDFIEAMLAAL